MPQLAAVRKPASRPDRTAYDIEAASMMSILSIWDHRFGKDGKMKIVTGTREGRPSWLSDVCMMQSTIPC